MWALDSSLIGGSWSFKAPGPRFPEAVPATEMQVGGSDHPLPLTQVRRGTAQGPGLLGRVHGGRSGRSGGHGRQRPRTWEPTSPWAGAAAGAL